MRLGCSVLCACFDGKRYKNIYMPDGKPEFILERGHIDHILTTYCGNKGDGGAICLLCYPVLRLSKVKAEENPRQMLDTL